MSMIVSRAVFFMIHLFHWLITFYSSLPYKVI